MFKVGDVVVYVGDIETNKLLKHGNLYTISGCFDFVSQSRQVMKFKETPDGMVFTSEYFMKNVDFRKEKIIKIKNNIIKTI